MAKKRKSESLLVLPDLHVPAHNLPALEWAAGLAEDMKVDTVVQVGDITDQRAWSRFDKDPDFDNPDLEWERTRKAMADLHELFPNMLIIQGNHDGRAIKRAMGVGIPRALVRGLEQEFPYAGWHWHLEPEPLQIELANGEGVMFIHGDEMPGTVGLKAAKLGSHLVQGHSHQAKLEYVTMFNKTIWGVEAGCLVDTDSSAFRYTVNNPRKVTLAVVLILDGVPHIIPYPGE